MSLPNGAGIRLRVYLGEKDQHQSRPLYLVLLERFRLAGAAGATVMNGLAGFGRKTAADKLHVLKLSDDVPIVIEVVDEPAREAALRSIARELAPGHLVTVERVGIGA